MYVKFSLLLCAVCTVRSQVCENQSDRNLLEGLATFVSENDQFQTEAQEDVTPFNLSTFDFIVVGAGTAGSVVASRLSESSRMKVLLIEAGREESFSTTIPFSGATLRRNEGSNWAYKTEPSDRYCLGMVDRQCTWFRGKVMGGSSVLDTVYARGAKGDYDRWAELGNDGWSYDEVLEYFKKMENMLIPELAKDDSHGTEGPVTVSYANYRTRLAEAFVEAGEELGFSIGDYNKGNITGFSYVQAMTVNGTRMSTNRAYLHKFRNNLYVTKESLVTKVLFHPHRKVATGVQFIKNGKQYTVFARKEVILSAGPIASPQLLMLSGVGPAEHLRDLGIRVVEDLPVGENLKDLTVFTGLSFVVNESVGVLLKDVLKPTSPALNEYLLHRSGPFSMVGGESLGFMNAFDPTNLEAEPNVELLFLSTPLGGNPILRNAIGLAPEIQKLMTPLEDLYSWSSLPVLLKPKSQGSLKLRSSKIHDPPIINPNYFDHPDDIQTLIAAVNASMLISQTLVMQRFDSKLFELDLENCKEYKEDFDRYTECAIRTLSVPMNQQHGTCKMGPEDDPTAVVSPRLLVHGIRNLRVVDAAVMPFAPSAHTNAPTILIAELASNMIKEEWNLI